MTNEQLARLMAAQFAETGDIGDDALTLAWATTEFTDLCTRLAKISDDVYGAFLKARERARPKGVEPRAATPTWSWGEVRPLVADAVLPLWPIHVLPPWMSAHVENMATQLQVPVDLCAQLAVGALSAASMGHAEVLIGHKWRETTNLYLATAMHSGAGKSPAEKSMTKPLREWEERRMDQARPVILEAERTKAIKEKRSKLAEDAAIKGGIEEERLAAVAWMDAANHDVPPLPRLLADDATPEALVQLLARHGGRMALLSTEADMLDMAAGAYSDGKRPVNLSVYLKGWSGDSIIVDRKGSNSKAGDELRIPNPLLTVSLTMQPTVIDWLRASGGQLEGRGLLARFMFALPTSRRGRRDRSMVLSNHVETAHHYAEEFIALADRWASWENPAELKFSHDANHRFVEWISELESHLGDGQRYAGVAEWMSKCQSSTARLAGLLHLCTGATSGPVEVDTVELAIEVGNYWIEHACAMAVVTDDDTVALDADRILAWIGRKAVAAFTPRDAWMPLRRQFPQVVDLVPALQTLEACGYLRRSAGEWSEVGVPRKNVTIDVNPDVLTISDAPLTWRAIWAEYRAQSARALKGVISTTTTPIPQKHIPQESARGARGIGSDAESPEPVDNPDSEFTLEDAL